MLRQLQVRWRLMLVAVFAFLIAGCGDPALSALNPSGTVANKQMSLIILSITIMIIVFVAVIGIYAYVLYRFRERPGDEEKIPEQSEGSLGLEITWTAIPIVLLIILAIPTVATTFTLAEDMREVEESEEVEGLVEVHVTAHQYWWEFEYPEYGIHTAQELVIPQGTRIQLELKSNDVIHSFWVPSLAGKMDTNPGDRNVNLMWFDALETGTFLGKCAELCGASHSLMDFRVHVIDGDEFDQWTASMLDFEPAPSTDLAVQGEQIFSDSCIACHATDAGSPGVGPNLAAFGDRDTVAGYLEQNKENVAKWIRNPDELQPGTTDPNAPTYMPAFDHLSDDEMDALVEYLLDLTTD